MKLQGSAVLHGNRERVFAALIDPGVLARSIPGCESLELIGEDSYKMTVSAGVGAIRGRYDGRVTLTDLVRQQGYVLNARGSGAGGTVDATCRIDLAGDGEQTELTYAAEATVGGPVAGVGQRMITAVAKRMAGQFFAAVDDELTGARAPLEPVGAGPAADAGAAAAEPDGAAATDNGDAGGAGPGMARRFAPYLPARRRGELVPVDARPLLLAGAGGALIALAGAVVGGWLARRRGTTP